MTPVSDLDLGLGILNLASKKTFCHALLSVKYFSVAISVSLDGAVLDEILNLIESVSEGFPSYFFLKEIRFTGNGLDFLSVKKTLHLFKGRVLHTRIRD